MIVLGAALFSAPAVVVLDDAGSSEALALTAIVGVTAALVAWRIARLVSETDRAREVLAESESRFRAFVQHSSDVVGVVDASGNDHLRQPVGARRVRLRAARAARASHPRVDPSRRRRPSACAPSPRLADRPFESESVEVRCLHADGSWRWAEATCTNQMHEPAVRGVVGNFRDVTERRRIEALGSRETQVLERILSGAPIPETLHILLQAVEEFLGDASATIRLFDAETDDLHRVAAPTLSPAFVEAMDDRLAEQASDAAQAYNSRFEPIIIGDIDDDPRFPAPGRTPAAGENARLPSVLVGADPHARRRAPPGNAGDLRAQRARTVRCRAVDDGTGPQSGQHRARPRRAHPTARSPRTPRHAHRPARTARSRSNGSTSALARLRDGDVHGRSALPRPRPVQGRQRRVRPRHR